MAYIVVAYIVVAYIALGGAQCQLQHTMQHMLRSCCVYCMRCMCGGCVVAGMLHVHCTAVCHGCVFPCRYAACVSRTVRVRGVSAAERRDLVARVLFLILF